MSGRLELLCTLYGIQLHSIDRKAALLDSGCQDNLQEDQGMQLRVSLEHHHFRQRKELDQEDISP